MAILSSPVQYIVSTPPATRVAGVLLIVLPTAFSWLQLHGHKPEPYLLVVPGSTIPFLWTLITAPFIELGVLQWLFTIVTILPACRYFEKLWGSYEIVKFTLITVAFSNALAVVSNWLEFAVLGHNESYLYNMSYEGMSALQTGILVAFTQLIPEHQVQILGVIKIRVKNIPMIYVTISAVLCVIGFQDPWLLIQYGWLVSWTYLRFYKRNPNEAGSGGESYGDRSETFAFVNWFPSWVQSTLPLAAVFNGLHHVALRLRLVRPFTLSPADLEGGYNAAPGGARAEAERRRAMALKALDQRMATSSTGNAAADVAAPAAGQSDITGKHLRTKEENKDDASASASELDPKGKGKAVATTEDKAT